MNQKKVITLQKTVLHMYKVMLRTIDYIYRTHQCFLIDKPASPRTSTPTAVVARPRFTFHCLNLKDMSDERRRELYQELYADSEDMMYKFQGLFESTTDSLERRNISAKELTRHLKCLGQLKPTFDDSGEPDFRHQLPELRKSESVDDAMSVVNKYCSFFNYRMVELIIQNLGTEQDKERLAKYKEDFAKYGERHVFECPSEVGEIYEEGQANMFVTLDDSFDKCNVNHLSAFVRNLQKVLNISGVSLRLCRIGPGSLKLIFQLSLVIQQAIFPLSSDQEAELVHLGIMQLSCGDYQFTVDDMMVSVTVMLLFLYPVCAGVGKGLQLARLLYSSEGLASYLYNISCSCKLTP